MSPSPMPKAQKNRPILSDLVSDSRLEDPQNPEYLTLRSQEIDQISDQINKLPKTNFIDSRDNEMERLSVYYDSFADLYQIDLRSVATTRMQMTATVMTSSVIWLQSIFEETDSKSSGLTFFDSRKSAGGFQFNANSEVRINNQSYVFSVLKRKLQDKEGEFEIDYPAYSLSRQLLSRLLAWHKAEYSSNDFLENPIVSLGLEIISRRVHDWIHSAILYDTASLSSSFQKWSDNSFFVTHLFDDPSMINYELLSNHLHFNVWSRIFQNNKGTKELFLDQLREYLQAVTQMEIWLKKEGQEQAAMSISPFLAFLAVRASFDVIPYYDPQLDQACHEFPIFLKAKSLLPVKYIPYLNEIYRPDKMIPFRKGSDVTLTTQYILQEYIDGVKEEALSIRDRFMINALITDPHVSEDTLLNHEFDRLPIDFQQQLFDQEIVAFDPRIFKYLNSSLKEISHEFGDTIQKLLCQKTEIDAAGNFFLKIDRDQIDFTNYTGKGYGAKQVTHSKKGLLVQVPLQSSNTYTLVLKRNRHVLSEQKSAESTAKSGDVILVNTQNSTLATKILEHSLDSRGEIDMDKFLDELEKERSKGFSDLGDVYTYDTLKAVQLFGLDKIEGADLVDGKWHIKPGHYSTLPSKRNALLAPGPISMDAPSKDSSRRRVLSGALVENHIKTDNYFDLFPVDRLSFIRFYSSTTTPSIFKVNERFSNGSFVDLDLLNKAVKKYLETLSIVNNIKIYGFRGKPVTTTFKKLLEERRNSGDQLF